ncbi:zinc finger protein 85-like [Topomyia yanbarensis]|uniref:zinc finger protein 85-like n=1 Tax=Topomyia yanbarensis TaxID=2498891 RepID=UPI00273C2638|nr:zinc finger protein 85-like [Topomyia yanbarensis]
MLLRQFISSSNAIEEIYIVKREDDSDNEENSHVDKLLPETGTVPASMTIAVEHAVHSTIDIKSEPEDEKSDAQVQPIENGNVKLEAPVESLIGEFKPDVNLRNHLVLKSEDEDDIPLAIRMRRKKHMITKSVERINRIKCDQTNISDSDDSDNHVDEFASSDLDKRSRQDSDCNICVLKFSTGHELRRHLRKKHSDMLPFRCDKCASKELKSFCSLNKHFEMHDPAKPNKCYYCEARFSSKIHRTAHQRRFHKDDLENDTIRNANRRFICRYCNKRFAAKFNLERHERNHEMKITDDESFLNRRNKCFLCDLKPCDTKEALNEHLSIHVDKLPYSCDRCENTSVITSIRMLNKHLASHEEPEKPIKCVYCNERFYSVVACQTHERTHAQEKQADEVAVAKIESERISAKIIIVDGLKRYECGYCGNSYSLLSTLRRHENIHTGKIQYICKICGKIFNKSSCLLQHERTHLQNAPYKCEICGRGFKETIRLIEHRRIHSGERPFTCEVCFRSFRIKPLLREHSIQCTAPDISMECKCRFCDSVFSCYRDLQDHVVSSHSSVIEDTRCTFCDMSFKSAINLVDHEYYHRNPNSIKCDVCGRIFKQHSNLRRHQRLHSNDAIPYQCDLCGKSFSQSGALKVHTRIHSGEKPYKCELCDKTFYHSSTMNRHKRSHYKAKSRLFLFAEQGRVSENEQPENVSSSTVIPVTLIHSQIVTNHDQQLADANAMLNLESVTLPVSVESHNFVGSQVPNSLPEHQQLSLGSFQINTGSASTTSGGALGEGTSLYVLDTKLLIPQTIMQHQDDSTAEDLDLGESIGTGM